MTSSNSLRFSSWLLWALVCMGLLAQKALAANEAAVVLFSHGLVTVTTSAVSHDLKKGDTVLAGSTIATGDKGRVQLRFNDGGLVSLMPNTQFAVDTYQQPSAAAEGEIGMNLIKGGLRALSGQIGKRNPDSYQLKTKVATLGIRGTQFTVSMDGDGMRVHVGDGQVILINELGELLVGAGQSAQVLPNQAPAPSTSAPNVGGAPANSDNENSATAAAAGADSSANGSTPDTQLAQGLPIALQQAGNADFETQVVGTPQPVDPRPIDPNPVDPNPVDPNPVDPTPELKLAAAYYQVGSSDKVPEASAAQTLNNINLAMKFVDSSFNLTGDSIATYQLDSGSGGLNYISDDLLWGWLGSDQSNPSTLFVLGNNIDHATFGSSGTLSYRYTQNSDNSSQVFKPAGQGFELGLSKFNLDLHLSTNQADVDIELISSYSQNEDIYFTHNGNFSWKTGSSSFDFDFQKDSIDNQCPSCRLKVAGVVAGASGANAGVTYKLGSGGVDYSGAVVLDKYQNIQYSPSNAAYYWDSYSPNTTYEHFVGTIAGLEELNTWLEQNPDGGFIVKGNNYNDLEANGVDIQSYSSDALFWGMHWASFSDGSEEYPFAAFFVLGQPTVLPTNGVLNYSLIADAASSVFSSDSNITELAQFDLSIHLGTSPSFNIDMTLLDWAGDVAYQFNQNNISGSFNQQSFTFLGSNGGLGCAGCQLTVSGVIAGANQEKAGVIYQLTDSDFIKTSGAAALEKTTYQSN